MDPRLTLRNWRESRGLTQAQCTKLLGELGAPCSQATYWNLERGDKQPRIDLAFAVQEMTAGTVTVSMWRRPEAA